MSAEEIVRGRIEAIRARCDAATPGPWYVDGWATWDDDAEDFAELHDTSADAQFIAHAREDIPYLLARVAELEGQLSEETSRRYQAECNYDHWKATCEDIRAQLTASQLTASQQETRAARNELCLKCGRYHEDHKGACDGCRWKEN